MDWIQQWKFKYIIDCGVYECIQLEQKVKQQN